MTDTSGTQDNPVCCFLIYDCPQDRQSADTAELAGLVKTLGLVTAAAVTLSRRTPTPQYALGSGKAREIADQAQEAGADCIVFDFKITPTQQRNWERLAGIPVYDREEIILRIFASRARTKEAVMQVELAKLQYALPRLAHTYGDMARQRGGSYGSKGSGETQLELDRRAIMNKIAILKADLRKVAKERITLRKRREKQGLPLCALVGYTNSGKSSLLNALTGSDVFAENALFATLDPTTRRLMIPGGREILLTDTVGFIRNLPHTLVDSFRSTLEEAVEADALLLVLDASDPFFEEHFSTVEQVLHEIGADKNERIIICNKIDALSGNDFLQARVKDFAQKNEAQLVSAKSGNGLLPLARSLAERFSGNCKLYRFPPDRADLEAFTRQNGLVVSCEWTDDSILVRAHTTGRAEKHLKSYEEPVPLP